MSEKTITAFARQFGLSRATLLYYDKIGLLSPKTTNQAGYRLYGVDEEKRMERVCLYRQAGLSLEDIKSLLDQNCDTALHQALEDQLRQTSQQLAALKARQRLIMDLLGRPETQMTVNQWVKMLEEAGVDEAGRKLWHQAFERDAPQEHEAFLYGLGLDQTEIDAIRARSQ